MGEVIKKVGMGWLPYYPDFRDYSEENKEIASMGKKVGILSSAPASIPGSTDLKSWCSPVEDQGQIGSCTSQAGVGVVEYFERRAYGKHINGSRLFVYKTTRNLLQWDGDTGAFLRSTMAALRLFGVPPENYWPYNTADCDKEPTAFCYSFAQNYQAIKYARLDPPNIDRNSLLKRIKACLAAGIPAMFGFTVFNSISQAASSGKIPFPCPGEKVAGGHAIVAVGYDDKMKIKNTDCGVVTEGALLIRNSWGSGWGDKGYGWFPYKYVLQNLAVDWWILLSNEWLDTGNFGL